jgi:hypothetical protein
MRSILTKRLRCALCVFLSALAAAGCRRADLPEKGSPKYMGAVRAFYVGLSALQVGDDVRAEQKLKEATALAPDEPAALPLDARLRGVTVNGAAAKYEVTHRGDIQHVEVRLGSDPRQLQTIDVVFRYDEGTGVYVDAADLHDGARSEGLRILRARADARALRMTLEGRGGRTYVVGVRTPRRLGTADGVAISTPPGRDPELRIRFDGAPDAYVRREIVVPFLGR